MSPDTTNRIVEGTTAFRWDQRARKSAIAFYISVVIGLTLAFIGEASASESTLSSHLRDVGLFMLVAVSTTVLFTGYGFSIARRRSERREVIQGYTTLAGSHLSLPQLHPDTGEQIRPAGEPFLSRDDFANALQSLESRPGHDAISDLR